MILTIDNLNGAGPVDYSAVLSADAPLTIERVLNAPSRCTGSLTIGSPINPGQSSTLLVPVRRARIVVSADSGTVLFTGYLATEPVPVYVGVGLAGPVYRVAFAAISDEWLLDKQTLILTADGFTQSPQARCSPPSRTDRRRPAGHLRSGQRKSHRRLHAPASPALVDQRRQPRRLRLLRLSRAQRGTHPADRRLRHPHSGLRRRLRRHLPPGRRAPDLHGQGAGQRRHPQRCRSNQPPMSPSSSPATAPPPCSNSPMSRSAPPLPPCSPTASTSPPSTLQTWNITDPGSHLGSRQQRPDPVRRHRLRRPNHPHRYRPD